MDKLTPWQEMQRYLKHIEEAVIKNLPLKFRIFLSGKLRDTYIKEVQRHRESHDKFISLIAQGLQKFNKEVFMIDKNKRIEIEKERRNRLEKEGKELAEEGIDYMLNKECLSR